MKSSGNIDIKIEPPPYDESDTDSDPLASLDTEFSHLSAVNSPDSTNLKNPRRKNSNTNLVAEFDQQNNVSNLLSENVAEVDEKLLAQKLSLQEKYFGIDMIEELQTSDEPEILYLNSIGYSFLEAAEVIFNRKRGLTIPSPSQPIITKRQPNSLNRILSSKSLSNYGLQSLEQSSVSNTPRSRQQQQQQQQLHEFKSTSSKFSIATDSELSSSQNIVDNNEFRSSPIAPQQTTTSQTERSKITTTPRKSRSVTPSRLQSGTNRTSPAQLSTTNGVYSSQWTDNSFDLLNYKETALKGKKLYL
jgi:hypothetical protein